MTWPHWDVYFKCFFSHGLGRPLWHPFGKEGAVLIGDVGWVHEGMFHPLFNSMRDEDHAVHFVRGVPRDFQPLTQSLLFMTSMVSRPWGRPTLQEGVFIEGTDLPYDHYDNATRNPFRFPKTPLEKHKGAALIAKQTRLEECRSRMHIISYIRANYESWLEFAASSSWNLTLQVEDILFISGTTMTTKWAMIAYQGQHNSREWAEEQARNLFVSGDSVDINNEDTARSRPSHDPAANVEGHHGPKSDREDRQSSREPDQCLFIHYYRVKRRMLKPPEVVQAGAGPHHIGRGPRGPNDPGGGNSQIAGKVEEHMAHLAMKNDRDPVNDLLDYVLQHSLAELAIASDLDLYAMFLNSPFPLDVSSALLEVQPTVHVDEDGVGTIVIDHTPVYERQWGDMNLNTNPLKSFSKPEDVALPEEQCSFLVPPVLEPANLLPINKSTNASTHALNFFVLSLYKSVMNENGGIRSTILQTLTLSYPSHGPFFLGFQRIRNCLAGGEICNDWRVGGTARELLELLDISAWNGRRLCPLDGRVSKSHKAVTLAIRLPGIESPFYAL